MTLLRPFRGIRPGAELVQQLAAPPYDVVSRSEAAEHARGNPYSFFHVSRPEISLPESVDEHDPRVYAAAREQLDAFSSRGWLRRDSTPRYYVYRQRMGSHVQTGLVAAASVEAYDRGDIRRHELTRADKEEDRTRHIAALEANDEPVFLLYRARPEVDALLAEATHAAPEYDFTTADGVGHAFWCVGEQLSKRIDQGFSTVDRLYIADGHHRSAAASRVHRERGVEGRSTAGDGSFLSVVFPHDQLQILGYHRAVTELNGLSPEAFLKAVGQSFSIEPTSEKLPTRAGSFGMYFQGQWHRLTLKSAELSGSPAETLDVSILQRHVLSRVLGVKEPRTDPRLRFIGGLRGAPELERRVESGEAVVAFSLFPTALEQLMAVADANEMMPPKSTWFEPKLLSGLVLHPFD